MKEPMKLEVRNEGIRGPRLVLDGKELHHVKEYEIKSSDFIGKAEAAKMLGMNHNTVRKGLQQGVFPWGYGIRTSENRWVYFINAKRFAEIEGIAF